jgi:hypothetical protein
MFSDNSLREPEPKARSRTLTRQIWFKESSNKFVRYTSSVIRDRDVSRIAPNFDTNGKPTGFGRHGINCVEDEIRQYLQNLTSKPPGSRRATEIAIHSDAVPPKLVVMQLQRGLGDLYQIDITGFFLFSMEREACFVIRPIAASCSSTVTIFW